MIDRANSTRQSIAVKLEEQTKILGECSLFTIEYAAKKLLTTWAQGISCVFG